MSETSYRHTLHGAIARLDGRNPEYVATLSQNISLARHYEEISEHYHATILERCAGNETQAERLLFVDPDTSAAIMRDFRERIRVDTMRRFYRLRMGIIENLREIAQEQTTT